MLATLQHDYCLAFGVASLSLSFSLSLSLALSLFNLADSQGLLQCAELD